MLDSVAKLNDQRALFDKAHQDGLRELQRFAELGRLSASLLHEISSPLTAAILHLEQLDDSQELSIRRARRSIQVLQRYVEAARQQVHHSSSPMSFCVRPELDQVKRILTPPARRNGVKLRINSEANYKIFGDPVKFQQIIANLVLNAIDAYSHEQTGSPREVTVHLIGRQQWIILKVVDHGKGMDAEQQLRLFEPFYTTKGRGNYGGLGIGLTIVKQYVETDFHGSVSVNSSAAGGTQFSIKLRTTPRYSRHQSV